VLNVQRPKMRDRATDAPTEKGFSSATRTGMGAAVCLLLGFHAARRTGADKRQAELDAAREPKHGKELDTKREVHARRDRGNGYEVQTFIPRQKL